MKQNDFDEYQLINRCKIGYKTTFFLMFVIFVNGFISEEYMWASPLTQALIILVMATAFFATMCIFKNAYTSNKVKNKFLDILFSTVLGLVSTVGGVLEFRDFGISHFIKDGKIQNGIMSIIIGALFIYISIILLIKYFLDKKQEVNE